MKLKLKKVILCQNAGNQSTNCEFIQKLIDIHGGEERYLRMNL